MRAGFFRGENTTKRALLTLIWGRLLVVSVILGLGIVILHGRGSESVEPLIALLGITFLLSFVYWIGAHRGDSPRFQVICQMLADVMLASAIIHFTGGAASPFALLYVLIISAGSGFFLVRGTMTVAILCTVSYGMLLTAEQSGLIGRIDTFVPFAGADTNSLVVLQVSLYGMTFLLLALLSGYLSFRVYRRGIDLANVKSRLRQVNLDTDQILRSMSSGVITVDRDGLIVHFNRAAEEIFNLNTGRVIGRQCRELFASRSNALVSMIEGTLQGGEDVLRQETTVLVDDNRPIPIGVSVSRLVDESEETVGVVAIFQDLTDVRKMEEQIRTADRLAAIGELSAGIAHEIRNPLATISGSIQVLQSELQVEGEQVHLLGLIVKESDRLHRIVEDFLDFARTGPANRREVNLAKQLEEMVRLIENHPKRHPAVKIRFRSEIENPLIIADDEQVRRVFLNLAVNALEAMRHGGELEIRIHEGSPLPDSSGESASRSIAVSIRDTGVGIPDSAKDDLFRPFFTMKKGGTGLGLAIAQKIVLSHCGRIEGFSDETGTTFQVLFPWEEATIASACVA